MSKHTRNEILKHYFYSYFKEDKHWKEILLKDSPYGYCMVKGKTASYVVPGEYGLMLEIWSVDNRNSIAENNTVPVFEGLVPYDKVFIDGAMDIIIEVKNKAGEDVRTRLKNFMMPNLNNQSPLGQGRK